MFDRIIMTLGILLMVMGVSNAQAHINLVEPKPLMNGHGLDDNALKMAPFGAPGIDVAAAEVTTVTSGSEIDLVVEGYITHPGYIVVSYTTDMTGSDVMPIKSVPDYDTLIPHKNILLKVASPCPDGNCKARRVDNNILKTKVKLPDIEGTIILVVRQVMTDKFDNQPDGSINLNRVYYHQAAKLNLVK